MPDKPGGDRDHSAQQQVEDVPIGLLYLGIGAGDVQAVELPAVAGQRIVVVGEPGHDPGRMWAELSTFLDSAGIPRSAGPVAPGRPDLASSVPPRLTRLRHDGLPGGVHALAWMTGESVILYTRNDLTPGERAAAVGRALIVLRAYRAGERAPDQQLGQRVLRDPPPP